MQRQVRIDEVKMQRSQTIHIFFRHATDKVFCYYESWTQWRTGNGQFKLSHVNPKLCTHITLAFIGLNADGTINELDSGPYNEFIKLKSKNANVKLLVSMGGWNEGSTTYSAVRKLRKK